MVSLVTSLVVVLPSSLLAVWSDCQNLSLDCCVFAAVVEVRGAGTGVVMVVVVVVTAAGLETEAVGLSLAGERKFEAGRGEEKVLEKVGGELGFSVTPSLELVVVVLVVVLGVKVG